MKKMRRLLCLLMASSMLASITLTVAAADYEAETYEQLEYAFAATDNEAGDTTVNVTVKNNIDFIGNSLTAMKDYTYNVSAAEGSGAALNNASFIGESGGGGTVVIDGMDLSGVYGLQADDGVNVTVNGNITGELDGVNADNSTVTVVGNITAEGVTADDAVQAFNSTVTVTGDLEGKYGVYANEGSNVTVNGDISAGFEGIYGYDSSIAVEGGIVSNWDSVVVVGCDVSVTGDITSGGTGVSAFDSEIYVDGNITAENNGVDAECSDVSVTGNVAGNRAGATIVEGNLSVGGNITGTEEFGLRIGITGSTVGTMNVSVGGAVSGGSVDIAVKKAGEEAEANVNLHVGSYNSIEFGGFTDAQKAAFIAGIKVGNQVNEDMFWNTVMSQELLTAEEGSTVTIDAGHRTTMPAKVVEIVKERNLTLIIQWDGGEDITIDASFDKEPVNGVYNLADL